MRRRYTDIAYQSDGDAIYSNRTFVRVVTVGRITGFSSDPITRIPHPG